MGSSGPTEAPQPLVSVGRELTFGFVARSGARLDYVRLGFKPILRDRNRLRSAGIYGACCRRREAGQDSDSMAPWKASTSASLSKCASQWRTGTAPCSAAAAAINASVIGTR